VTQPVIRKEHPIIKKERRAIKEGKIGNMPHPGHVENFKSHHKFVKFFITPNVTPVLISHQI